MSDAVPSTTQTIMLAVLTALQEERDRAQEQQAEPG